MSMRVTQAGALVRLGANQKLLVTQVGAIVRVNLVQVRTTQVGALVRLALLQVRASQMGVLVRCTPEAAQAERALAVFGLREVKLVVDGWIVALDAALTVWLQDRATSGQLSGNDRTVGVATVSRVLDWELEAGGIPLAAWALMTGRVATVDGTTPEQTQTLAGMGQEEFIYFQMFGKAITDSDRVVYVKLFRVKLRQAPQGLFGEGRFWQTQCGGVAIAAEGDPVYELVIADDSYEAVPN